MVKNMAKYPFRLPPLPSDDESIIIENSLVSLAGLPPEITVGGDGTFSSNGFTPNTTGVLTVTGVTRQNLLINGGFISLKVETSGITKAEGQDGKVNQSTGDARAALGVPISIQGDTGTPRRIYLGINPTTNSIALAHGGESTNLPNTAINSLNKGTKVDILLLCFGNRWEVYADKVLLGELNYLDYDSNQSSLIYIGANNFNGANNFGPYALSDLQIGVRAQAQPFQHSTVSVWGDSFIANGLGINGVLNVPNQPAWDVDIARTAKRRFAELGIKIKIVPFGFGGFSWSDSAAFPQSDNEAAVANEKTDILIMTNSVNFVQGTPVLVADYQSSLEARVDYQVTNNPNLKTILFTSMMPFTQNLSNIGDKTSGVIEDSNLVFENLVAYVEANYPQVNAIFYDMFSKTGKHEYPAEWTYGIVSNTDNLHLSAMGENEVGEHFYNILKLVI